MYVTVRQIETHYERLIHVYNIQRAYILPCLLLLKGQSTFLEVPAMHRKEPASRDVFASEDLTLPCCYATVASSWQKVAQTPRKHAICQELYATGPWTLKRVTPW